MAVKTEDAAPRRPAARTPGGGSARTEARKQLSRADREARGKDARAADQNDRDHAALQAAVKEGRTEATTDI